MAGLAGLRRPHGDEPGAAFAGFAAPTWPLLSLDAMLLLGTVWVANVLGSRGPEVGRVLVLAFGLAGVVVFDVLVVRGFWRWVHRPRATSSHSGRASDGAGRARNSS